MKNSNFLLKIFSFLSIILTAGPSFGQSNVKNPAVINNLKETNSSILMPVSPLGMALFVFMLIITLAFAITRLKNEDLVRS